MILVIKKKSFHVKNDNDNDERRHKNKNDAIIKI